MRCFGEVRRGASGLEMYHPEYRLIDDDQPTPVDGLADAGIPDQRRDLGQNSWRKLCGQAVSCWRHRHRRTCCRTPRRVDWTWSMP